MGRSAAAREEKVRASSDIRFERARPPTPLAGYLKTLVASRHFSKVPNS